MGQLGDDARRSWTALAAAAWVIGACTSSDPAPRPGPTPSEQSPPAPAKTKPPATPQDLCRKFGRLADRRAVAESKSGRDDDPEFLEQCLSHYEGLAKAWPQWSFDRLARCVQRSKTQLELAECQLRQVEGAAEPRNEVTALALAVMRHALEPGPDGWPRLRCPGPDGQTGSVGPTPPLSERCAANPEGCATQAWTTDPVWSALGFSVDGSPRFHYAVRWRNDARADPTGCQFTAQAFGDLDDDGVFSTYERAAAIDGWGPVSPGIYIDREDE